MYSSALEKESSRFSQPGDFFTYIIFLGLFIVVCRNFLSIFSSVHCVFEEFWSCLVLRPLLHTSYICPPSQYLAEAVPENEGDYPYISC